MREWSGFAPLGEGEGVAPVRGGERVGRGVGGGSRELWGEEGWREDERFFGVVV